MKQFFNQQYLPQAIKILNHYMYFVKKDNFFKILQLFPNLIKLRKELLSHVFNKEFDILVAEQKDLISDLDSLHLNLLSLISFILLEFKDSYFLNRTEYGILEETEEFYVYFEEFLSKINKDYKEKKFNQFVINLIKNSEEE